MATFLGLTMMKRFFHKGITVAAVAMAMMMLSCGHRQNSAYNVTMADSLINLAYNVSDLERVIALADSLEQAGDISPFKSAHHRGEAYRLLSDFRHAEEVLKPVMDMKPANSQDSLYYNNCVFGMAEVLLHKDDYEGVLRIGLPLMERLSNAEGEKNQFLGPLSQFVGSAQLSLGMKEDAVSSFDMSYDFLLGVSAANPIWQNIANVFSVAYNICTKYQGIGDYESAEKWYHRQDSILAIFSKRDDVPASVVDQFAAANCITRGLLALGQKDMAELNRAIADYKKTESSKTHAGLIDEAGLLMGAERYAEAADDYVVLDQFYKELNLNATSLENITRYMTGKFEANYKAGRRDSALAVAAYIVENLDSAFIKQKESDAAELATIYQTQQKDAEIAQQQIALSRQRLIAMLTITALLTAFFIIYMWYSRRAANRLGEAHVKLQNAHSDLKSAYDQLEETTAAKERIESELRIARDIQMSMVPGIFPEREGLDMYAEMTPAKEVGGDLYGYVMLGDRLYFCVGDVSGKGVPASLFMAQSARLFRTLAAEGMMPADIAFRMNNEMAEGNDNNMFVTMFIGMLHLDTGRLDYCNCGHNAPILDGQFLKMAYVNQPLGLWEDDPCVGETIDDIRGRQLLIYTDGLNEAENGQEELLGNARLLELMANTVNLSSREVIDMLKEAVEQHRNGAEPNDDLTLMCITFQI